MVLLRPSPIMASIPSLCLMMFIVLLSLNACYTPVLAAEEHRHYQVRKHDIHHRGPNSLFNANEDLDRSDDVQHHRHPQLVQFEPRSPSPLPPPILPGGSPPSSHEPNNNHDSNNNLNETMPSGSHLLCTPFGACEPCPPESLHQPFCQPFGNRRLMHCVNATSTTTHPTSSSPPSHPPSEAQPKQPNAKLNSNLKPEYDPSSSSSSHPQEGETLAWESCGRIPAQERADFWEFVACNVLFALVSLGIVLWRSKVLQARQARVLAARIGLVGSSVRGRR